MKPIHTFTVIPSLPVPLERLRELAYNLRWSWNHETIRLFRRLDDDLWQATGHNPVLMLGKMDQARLEEAASNESFLAHLERVCAEFDAYIGNRSTWFQRAHGAAHRLFLGRVWPDGMSLDLCRWAGDPGWRPPEVSQRPGDSPGGRRASLPTRLLSPAVECVWLAAGTLRR